jgi:uncharacterized protein (DUF1778 family)
MHITSLLLSIGINLILMAALYIKIAADLRRRNRSQFLLKEIREEAEEIVREINQVTDRNIALVENSVRRISDRIEEADKRITLLGKAAEKENREQITYSHLRKTVPLGPAEDLPDFDRMRTAKKEEQELSKRDEVLKLSENGFSSQVIARKTGLTIGEVELMVNIGGGGKKEVDHDNRY